MELHFLELCAGSHRLADVALKHEEPCNERCLHPTEVPENAVRRPVFTIFKTLSGSHPVGKEQRLELSFFGQGLPYCNYKFECDQHHYAVLYKLFGVWSQVQCAGWARRSQRVWMSLGSTGRSRIGPRRLQSTTSSNSSSVIACRKRCM